MSKPKSKKNPPGSPKPGEPRSEAEESLRRAHDELEQRVRERTAELTATVERLHAEAQERTRAEDALRRAEQEKAAILNGLKGVHVEYVDPDMRIIWANAAMGESFGQSVEGLRGKHCYQVVQGRTTLCPDCTALKAFETGQPQEGEVTLPDGSIRMVRSNPLKDAAGKVTSVVHMAVNITERRRAEEALRESEDRFRTVIETSADAIALIELDGRILMANQQAARFVGFDGVDDLLSNVKNGYDLLAPEDHQRARENTGRLIEAGVLHGIEYSLIRRDGSRFPVEVSASLVRDPRGDPKASVMVFRDITERRLAENALQQEKAFTGAIIESLPGPFYVLDEQGRMIRCNRVHEELMGRPTEDLLGMDALSVIHEEDRPRVAEGLAAAFAKGYSDTEARGVLKDGEIRHFFFNARRMEIGGAVFLVGMGTDITARKRAEEALREREELYRSLVENLTVGVTLVDSHHTIVTISPMQARMFGKTVSEFPGKKCYREFEKREAVCPHCPGVKAMATGETAEVETEGVRDDGSRFAAVVKASPWRGPDGAALGFIEMVEDVTPKRRAEEKLRESEQWYRTLFVEALDGICLVDANTGLIIDCNQALAALVGRDKAELIGQPQTVLHPPAVDHEQFSPTFRQHLGDKAGEILDTQVVNTTGEVKEVAIRARTLDLAGKTVMQGMFRDITDRKRAEQALQEREQELSAIYENAPLVMMLVDGQRRVCKANKFAGEFVGEPAENLLGRRGGEALRCVHSLDDPQGCGFGPYCQRCTVRRTVMETLETGRNHNQVEAIVPFAIRGEVQNIVFLLCTARLNVCGQVRVLVTMQDITERKRAEESLRRSHEELEAMYDGISDGLLIAEVNTARFVRANRLMCRMLRYSETELLSLSVRDIHPADELDIALASFNAMATGDKTLVEGLPVLRKDGSVFFADISTSAIVYGGRSCLMGFFRDVTDRRQHQSAMARAKEAAEAANRAKSEFLANMSHEIRTPMTAILGFSDLLATPNLPHEEQGKFLEAIQRNGKALLELINDILDLSRIEADKLVLEKADWPLQQIVEDVLSVVRVRAREKRLSLEADYRFPLPEKIHTDPGRLRQILVNLAGNAIKFTEKGGVRITVRCVGDEDDGARVQFAVSDTGIGIAADKIPQLFRPFVQADASLTRRFGGSGLGLAISRRLAEALGGTIEVASQLGQGSTFTLSIRAGSLEGVRMLQSPQADPAPAEVPLPGEPKVALRGRVLLAEDVPAVQAVVSRILEGLNLQIEIADNGRLACEMAEKSKAEGRPYELILMDIQMPELNGYEATQRLRRSGWHGPIVALTAHAMLGDREKCLDAGCDDYIAKPVAARKLLDVLTRYLAQPAGPASPTPSAERAVAQPAGLPGDGVLNPADAAELLEEFAGELPARARTIEDALRTRNRDSLAELAHQLKGTAGMYGFTEVSEAAREIHRRATEEEDLEQLQAAVQDLVRLCGQRSSQRQGSASGHSPCEP